MSEVPIDAFTELWALLHFIMPSLFDSHDEFNEWFSKDIESGVGKKGGRGRSDSAPLGGYGLTTGWPQTRPRSGSGLQSARVNNSRRDELPVPNIGSLSRGHALPMLSIPGVPKQSQP